MDGRCPRIGNSAGIVLRAKDPPENKDLLGHQALLDHKALPARKVLPAWQAPLARPVYRGLLALLVLPGLREK